MPNQAEIRWFLAKNAYILPKNTKNQPEFGLPARIPCGVEHPLTVARTWFVRSKRLKTIDLRFNHVERWQGKPWQRFSGITSPPA